MEKCETCGFEAKTLAGRLAHERSHAPVEEQPAVVVEEEWNVPNALKLENKDPNYRYRFLNPRLIEHKGMREWEFVEGNDAVKVSNPLQKPADSRRWQGDLILGRMPEGRARAREKYYAKRNAATTTSLPAKVDSQLREKSSKGITPMKSTVDVTQGGLRNGE